MHLFIFLNLFKIRGGKKKMEEEKLKKEIAKKFQVTSEDIEKVKSFDPYLNIELDKKYRVKFLENEPREIEIPEENRKFGRSKSLVISAELLEDNMTYTLWCTPETLRVKLAQLAIKHNGSLKGVIADLGKKLVETKQWGMKNIYWVKEVIA